MEILNHAVVQVVLRVLHLGSAFLLVGGAFTAALAWAPGVRSAQADVALQILERVAKALRPWVIFAILFLFLSGILNLLTKTGVPRGYHMWFGIKFLLALHVLAISILQGRAGIPPEKRTAWWRSVAISGGVVIVISAYLRTLSLGQ